MRGHIDDDGMSQQLSSLDATFLELEDADEAAHMHIGAVMVFEAPPDGIPSLDRLRTEIALRLELLPRYRSKLTGPHVGPLRRPGWEPDPAFAIEEHVRRAALPAPGGEQELMDWCAEFWSARLDRSRPLWETVLVEGLEGGRWALATKTHHALVDGVGAADAGQLLLDVSRAGSRRRTAGQPVASHDAERDGIAEHLGDLVRGGVRLVSHPARLLSEVRTAAELMLREELVPAPRSSLNVPIGPHRRYAVARARLKDLKAIKNALGGTVNDVVLTVAAGGLRRLLAERGDELPEHGLRAMVPVDLRGADERAAARQPGQLAVRAPTRLRARSGAALPRHGRGNRGAEVRGHGPRRRGADRAVRPRATAAPLRARTRRRRARACSTSRSRTSRAPPGRSTPSERSCEEVLPLVPLAADHAVGHRRRQLRREGVLRPQRRLTSVARPGRAPRRV